MVVERLCRSLASALTSLTLGSRLSILLRMASTVLRAFRVVFSMLLSRGSEGMGSDCSSRDDCVAMADSFLDIMLWTEPTDSPVMLAICRMECPVSWRFIICVASMFFLLAI